MLSRVTRGVGACGAEIEGRAGPAWSEWVGISLFFAVISALYLRMSPARFWTALAPDFGDPLFNLSVLRWGASRVSSAFSEFWDPTYFFPVEGVLALSDHLIGPAVLYRLLDAVGLSPAAAYNSLLWIAFAGSGATCHWVLRRSGLSLLGALGGAFIWTFCGFRWSALSHLQVLLALGVPVALWLFHRLLLQPSWPSAGRFLFVYALQLSAGVYLALMLHVSLLAIFWVHAYEFASGPAREVRKAPLAATVAACAAMLGALCAPYLAARESLGVGSPVSELIPYLVTLKSYLSVGARTLYSDAYPDLLKAQAQLWPGFVAAGLCLLGGVAYLRRRLRPKPERRESSGWLFLLLLGCCLTALLAADLVVLKGGWSTRDEVRTAVLTFRATFAILALTWVYWLIHRHRWLQRRGSDTDLWWRAMLAASVLTVTLSHAAAFVLLREALPGFSAIRVPGRFFVFSSVGLAALAGLGIDRMAAYFSKRGVAACAQGVLLALLACELIPDARYIEWQDLRAPKDVASDYQWLEAEPDVHALLELPFRENWREAERMYAWTIHHRPIVNGYSGHLPRSYQLLKEEVGLFPNREVLSQLERLGVSHLVVHLGQCTSVGLRDWRRWQRKVVEREDSPIVLIREHGWDKIYRLVHHQGAAAPSGGSDLYPQP